MRSPYHITYADLIKEEERNLARMKSKFGSMVRNGQMNEYAAKRKLALKEQLVKMLKKQQKNPQLSLEDLFNQMK